MVSTRMPLRHGQRQVFGEDAEAIRPSRETLRGRVAFQEERLQGVATSGTSTIIIIEPS